MACDGMNYGFGLGVPRHAPKPYPDHNLSLGLADVYELEKYREMRRQKETARWPGGIDDLEIPC